MAVQKISYQNKEEWLNLRRKYIGGSDAGAVVGLNPYKSAYTLWAEKTGKAEEFTGNTTTKVGEYLEALVARMFTEETGLVCRRNNFLLVNDKYPFACADIDRDITGINALLEIKTTTSFPIMKKINKTEQGDFPEPYYAQCVHYLAVTGYGRVYLAVLINCRELKIFQMERADVEDDIEALMKAEEAFYQHIVDNTPPEIDGSGSTSGTIDGIAGDSSAGVEADVSAYEDQMAQYFVLDAQIKVLEEQKDAIANRLKDYLKDAEKGASANYSVSYKTQIRKTFDAKTFAAYNVGINLEPFYKTSSSRPFRITKKN